MPPPSPFPSEEISNGSAADLADFDGDGLANFLEYALGSDPRTASTMPSPLLDASGHLTLTLSVPKALPWVTYSGQATSDFVTTTPITSEVIVDGDPQTIRLVDPVPRASSPRRFLWLRVSP